MGYSTEFTGRFELDRPLTPEHAAYLKRFSDSRRMKRNADLAALIPDPLRIAVGLPIGDDGSYFVGTDEGDADVYLPGDPRFVTVERVTERDGRSREISAGWAEQLNQSPSFAGQRNDASVDDYNVEPAGQPGLWCKWAPTEDARGIEWNGVEKFGDYVEWLQYLMDHFLSPWGYVLSGEVQFQGESKEDKGVVRVVNGKAEILQAQTA